MSNFTFDDATVRDLYKDAWGSRPTSAWDRNWAESSNEQKQVIWDGLCEDLEVVMSQEKIQAARAVEAFEASVQRVLETVVGISRERAIMMLVEAEGYSHVDLQYGAGFVCYSLGLPYSMKATLEPVVTTLLQMETN